VRPAARKLTLQCIGVTLAAIALLLGWMLFTTSGSSTSLNALKDRFSTLEYTYKSGTLARGLYLEKVRWTLRNNTVVSAPNVTFRWNPACWHARELCISELIVDQLVIDVARDGEPPEVKTLAAIDLPVSIMTDSMSIGEIIVNNVGDSPMIFSNVEFSGALKGAELLAEKLRVDWLWLQADLSGKLTLNKNYPIAANGTLVSTDPGLALPVKSQWDIGGDLLSLVLDADITAPYQGKLSGTYSLLRNGLPADVTINWDTAPWPRHDSEPGVFVDNGELVISGTGPDYKTHATAVVHGTRIPSADVVLQGKINSRKATFFPMTFNTLGGQLKAEGVFKWRNGLSWNANLDAAELWPDLYWPRIKGLLNGTTHFTGRSHNGQTRLGFADIAANGTMHGHQFQLTGDVVKDPFNNWHLSAVEAVNNDNQIYANGTIGPDSNLKLLFNSRSIQQFVEHLHGGLHGDVTITGDLLQPDISGAVSSASLRAGELQLTNVKSEGVIRKAGHQHSEVTTVAETVRAKQQQYSNARLNFNGSLFDHMVKIAFDHEFGTAEQLHVEGSLRDKVDWRGTISAAHGRLYGHPIKLQQPFNARWLHDQRSLVLEPHCWRLDLANGCVTNTATVGANGRIKFAINALELHDLNALPSGPLAMAGTLYSNGELTWGYGKSPGVTINGDINQATVSVFDSDGREKVKLPLDSVNMNVTTTGNQVASDIRIKTNGLGAVNIRFDVDTSENNYPLNGSVALASSNVNWLRAYLPDATTLDGKLSADGIIAGTLADPLIDGVINFEGGTVSSAALPIDLENIALDIQFNNNESHIKGTAVSGDTPIRIKGTRLHGDENWSSTINVAADNLHVDTDFVRGGLVSPNLDIHITPLGVRVNGKVDVHRANVVVNDLAPGGIATSSDVVIVDASDRDKQRAPVSKQYFATELDVSLGKRVRFTGYGLKADLSGDFKLALDTKRPPELIGEIMVDNGTYRSYGQNLLIRDGRITFVGPLEQTAVTVEAVREVDNILAGLRVDGSLQNPTTTLFSEPSLPKEEILSYVVLGRSLEFGSTDDSQMLTNAALFMGISNGRSFSQNIAENLGIEDFYLTATGTGDETQVMLSGRLNNRLLIRYGVGVFNAVNTLFLRYDLAEQLYIETTQGLEKAIDIFYSFEF
jgi:translocation and assembly module TamB